MFVATQITPTEQIFRELGEIQSFLDASYSSDNPAACSERLDSLQGYMARSGKLFADAEWHYYGILNGEIIEALRKAGSQTMSTSTLNKYVDSACKEYKYLVTWSERINRTCTHLADQMRTVISYHKAQMTN